MRRNEMIKDEENIRLLLCRIMKAGPEEFTQIQPIKQGMTNRSYLFTFRKNRFIFRIPGEGTEHLISRAQEFEVYRVMEQASITDRIVYLSKEEGYKITEYWEEAKSCDASDWDQVERCINVMRGFHQLELSVSHTFDVFERIDFYESLWKGKESQYEEYASVKKQVMELKHFIDASDKQWGLAHIDAVCDNFLFVGNEVKMLDWEYAGMQDQHVDIAMFAIYAFYDREEIDRLIQIYFNTAVPHGLKLKVYAYIAACGLLWSNWCEYKHLCGVDFSDYAKRQFQYAKEYSGIVREALNKTGEPDRVNAIIMAAGMSKRLAPLSYKAPKALFPVRGEVLIERQIKQLLEAGINEIIVVTGYKKEMFLYLQEKYAVILVENPDYENRNNHSSLYHARKYLKNTYICSADNYFTRNVFMEPLEESSYAAVYRTGATGEWCLRMDEQGYIDEVTIGGEHAWVMLGYAFFGKAMSEKMKVLLKSAYGRETCADWYWEDIYRSHLKDLKMKMKPYEDGIIYEIDTLEELIAFDPSYKLISGDQTNA